MSLGGARLQLIRSCGQKMAPVVLAGVVDPFAAQHLSIEGSWIGSCKHELTPLPLLPNLPTCARRTPEAVAAVDNVDQIVSILSDTKNP